MGSCGSYSALMRNGQQVYQSTRCRKRDRPADHLLCRRGSTHTDTHTHIQKTHKGKRMNTKERTNRRIIVKIGKGALGEREL